MCPSSELPEGPSGPGLKKQASRHLFLLSLIFTTLFSNLRLFFRPSSVACHSVSPQLLVLCWQLSLSTLLSSFYLFAFLLFLLSTSYLDFSHFSNLSCTLSASALIIYQDYLTQKQRTLDSFRGNL